MPVLGRERTMAPTHCPACRRPVTRTAGYGHDGPRSPGDLCICIKCTAVNVYCADGTLRRATADEAAQFAASPEVQRAVQAILRLHGGTARAD